MRIQFKEFEEEYYFDAEKAEHNYTGSIPELVITLKNIESNASIIEPQEPEDGSGRYTAEKRVYSPEKAHSLVTSILEDESDVTIIDDGKAAQKGDNGPQIVEGPLTQNHPQVIDLGKDDVPDDADHVPPGEEAPEGWPTFEGPRGGTYTMSPEQIEEATDGEVTAEEVEEHADSGVDGGGGGSYSDAASDKVPEEDRERPDGVSGPIEEWDPDDVEEAVLSPKMRYAEIGSEAHPVFWRQPEAEELDDYVEGVRQEESWSEGQSAFEDAFFGDDNTATTHQDEDGNWDEERLEKHDEWTDDLLNENAVADEDEQPVGMVVLGPPGAGKGWWQEQVESGEYGDRLGGREFTHLNSDETKEPIPEYTGTNSSEVHEEASKMASEDLAPKSIDQRHHVILDKVSTTPDGMMETVSKMQEAGYDIRASFVDVPEEKAVHNAVSRFYQEGRFTPFDYLLEGGPEEGESARDGSKKSFEVLLEEAGIPEEKVGRFNNDVEWGNAPDAEEVGEELLKTLLEFYGIDLVNKYMQ